MLPKVSIVIVNYNCEDIIECIKSVKDNNYPKNSMEIIVVDNNSTDGSVIKIKRSSLDVKLISLDKNYGYGIGCNYGAKYSHGKYLVFLNPDSLVDKNWLQNLVNIMESEKTIGTVTSKIMYYYNKKKINSLGCFLSIFGICGSLTSPDYVGMPFTTNFDVFAPSGASFIIEKETFRKISGFDENLFLYSEDVDIGWRVLTLGLRNVVSTSSIMYHKTESSTLSKKKYFYFYNTRNNLLIIVKNATFPYIIPMLTFSFFIHLVRFLVYIVVGRISHAMATLKGIFWIFGNLNKVIEMRNSLKNRNDKYVKFIMNLKESIPMLFGKTAKHLT